ncbi:hypothetical protein EAG14_22400 [Acidovorax sp. 1608163]|nr:hypothetical protein EAG14_22400 [Acidovorax sp. 1608163]
MRQRHENFSDISITTKDSDASEEIINTLKLFKNGYLLNTINQTIDNTIYLLGSISKITREHLDNNGFQSLLKKAKEVDYKYKELKTKYEKLPK